MKYHIKKEQRWGKEWNLKREKEKERKKERERLPDLVKVKEVGRAAAMDEWERELGGCVWERERE